MVRNLAKEATSSAGIKRGSGEAVKASEASTAVERSTYAAVATALRPISYVTHNHTHPTVINIGSARLEAEDKVKKFWN